MIEERLKHYQSAVRRLESVRDLVRQRPESIAALARAYYKLGDAERARAVLADLNQESAFLDLVRTLGVENEWRPILEICNQGIQKFPASGPLFEVKGLAETMLLHTADAIRSYSRALEINPNSPRANLGLATSQVAAGMYAEAQKTFARGIRDFPEDALHFQEYGLLLVKLGQTGDAAQEARGFELLEQAIALNSNLGQANYHIGQAALERGDTAKAIACLERARQTEPNVSKIRFALARAYGRVGKKDQAARELEAYQRLKAEEERSSPGFAPDGRASKRPEE
jgi:tetratricopeptide (TPR) repeat protein